MQNLNDFQEQERNGQPQYSQMSPDQVMESLKNQQQHEMIDENEYSQQQQQHYTGQQSMGQHSLNTGDMQNISKQQKSIGTTRKWMWAYPQIEGVPPCPRGGHSSTLTGASLVIFGGHYYSGKETGYVYLNDTHVLDVNASRWIKPKISGTPPPARYGHTSVLAGSRIIIFGGKGQKNLVFRDLHALDPVSMTWYQGPEGGGAPTARFNHSANLVGGTKMLVFGGWNGMQFFNDLYVLDLEIMAWTKPNTTGHAPTPRKGHCAILIGANLVIHGGFCFDQDKQKQSGIKQGTALRQCYYNDIRVLDTETYSWSRLRVGGTPPQPRFSHTMDISNADILMFGGWTLQSGMRSKHEATSENCQYFLVWSTETMNWERGKYVGTPPTSRFGHTSTAIGPHLLIFGGWQLTKAQNEIIVLRECTSQAPSQNQSQQQPVLGNEYQQQMME